MPALRKGPQKPPTVIPAKAGTQRLRAQAAKALDSRVRGNDGLSAENDGVFDPSRRDCGAQPAVAATSCAPQSARHA
ncbi:hypothetical protein EA655_07805 [Pseudoxanthomonas winnipegensis]|uniref:Uncharacterized protein n=1 Tax=Pseudoxanthomonas winnipegensis TaxID=2480810 RepID=A0A4Q8M520_9GAMM|nr:hypothetical protein EA655_07805 [Pseudoxanthomonas winnipegensis]